MPSLIGRTLMGFAGRKLGRTLGGASGGPLGMAVGIALPTVTRALGPVGVVGMLVGSWVIKRALDKRQPKQQFHEEPHPPTAVPPASV